MRMPSYSNQYILYSCNCSTSSHYTGDYENAVDTLKMAVSLIKQSITASSDASQVCVFDHLLVCGIN